MSAELIHLYRLLYIEFPNRTERIHFARLHDGLKSLFLYKEKLHRWEINSIEYTVRKMEI